MTINDRVTGLVWLRLLSGKEANTLMEVTVNALKPFMHQIHTITADNGKEFSFHEEIARKLEVLFTLQNHTILGKEEPMRIPMD